MLKNITFSAEEAAIDRGRRRAAEMRTTLNAAFRDWLDGFATGGTSDDDFDRLMERLSYVKVGRRFTRDEKNER